MGLALRHYALGAALAGGLIIAGFAYAWARAMAMYGFAPYTSTNSDGAVPDLFPLTPPHPSTKVTSTELMREARTLRERAFARVFHGLRYTEGLTDNKLVIHFIHTGAMDFEIDEPRHYTLKSILNRCRYSTPARTALANIRLLLPPLAVGKDVQLTTVLQDLANIVAMEARRAFRDDYYPGIPDVDVPEELIDVLMPAMQREIDREELRSPRGAVTFVDLPRDRQRALAERRRFWFSYFGVTPKVWKRQFFSLWRVPNERVEPVYNEAQESKPIVGFRYRDFEKLLYVFP